MMNLTFGEQVKIVLSRKGMTIKELAEQIEEKTGKKMSRQNLTQRLGRDNFQEQDMRMIAEILGCSFQLSILASAEAAEKAMSIEEELPTERELNKLAAKKEMKLAKAQAKEETARDITVGEVVDFLEEEFISAEAVKEVPEEAEAEEAVVEEAEQAVAENEGEKAVEEAVAAEIQEEQKAEPVQEAAPEQKEEEHTEKFKKTVSKPKYQDFIPIKKRVDEEENKEVGEINPYTGHEYQTNSVRMHPKRIGYVQVYDRKEHKWTDMTEWAFIGMEEHKKSTQGKSYIPPIYLD